MPWTTVFNNVLLPLKLKGVSGDKAQASVTAALDRVGLQKLRARLSARTLRRHAHARLHRARARHRAGSAADGRAVRGARRDHALQAQQRSVGRVAGAAHDGGVRHAFGVRIGVPVEPHRGHGGAAGPRLHRACHRRALSARSEFPHLGRIRRVLPPHLGSAWRRPWRLEASHEQGASLHSVPSGSTKSRSRAAHRAADHRPGARSSDLGSGRPHRTNSALRAAGARPHLANADRRLVVALAIAAGDAAHHVRGLSAGGDRRRRPRRAVQSVPAARIFALSLCRDPAGDADRRRRAAASDLSAAAARGARPAPGSSRSFRCWRIPRSG